MEFALARYRLLFTRPFGTAHGVRDGTDSVFVRLSHEGRVGYGEATLPPYTGYSQEAVHEQLVRFWLEHSRKITIADASLRQLDQLDPPARAAFKCAYNDLIAKYNDRHVESVLLGFPAGLDKGASMVTIGYGDASDIPLKIKDLPSSTVLKVKLGGGKDKAIVKAVSSLDERPLFLDANQGWTDPDEAEAIVQLVGEDRLVGIEQPFPKHRWDLHETLKKRIPVPVYGDESIQGEEDLERAPEAFGGVNLKLMKCGGLDIAGRMAVRARELGLKVMLGSMSESSLGCAAMFALSSMADLVDLDGPWLIRNDPFQGLEMDGDGMRVTGRAGFGVHLKADHDLRFEPIGA
ncbi:MAG TPA: enolase C-terminal domain-like protein [Flavobacteriales bacterium]|nr:enolase C-terminal domain-like protein [Flavobacteriales bacterium]